MRSNENLWNTICLLSYFAKSTHPQSSKETLCFWYHNLPKTLFVFGSHPQVIDLPKTLSRCFCYLTHHHLPKTPSVFGTHCNLPFFPVSLPETHKPFMNARKLNPGFPSP
jgi:hypothetical protein